MRDEFWLEEQPQGEFEAFGDFMRGERGPEGPIGPAGKSAYQQAVDGGYTGTEEEFNEAMAAYPELTDDVSDLKNAFNADLVPTTWTPTITKGSYFKVADGSIGNSSKYARTSALWDGYGTRKAIVLNDPTYEFCLALYDETGTTSGTGYLGYIRYATGTLYIPQNAILFGISFRRVNQAALTDADITAISAALSALAATDTTLSVAGAAADAKETGEAIESVSQIASQNASDIGDLKAVVDDPLFDKLVHLPEDDSFFDKQGITTLGTYTKINNRTFSISGGSGSAYYNYPLHGTNKVVYGPTQQMATRLTPSDLAPIPESGSWGNTTYSVGMRIYSEANTTASNRNLEIDIWAANVQDGEFIGEPVVVASGIPTNNTKYGTTIVRLRGTGFAPLSQYTHYGIYARTRSRSSSAVATIRLDTVQSTRLMQYILYPTSAIETTETASRAHAVNTFILLNDRLYRVILPISAEDQIVVGTNVTQVSILEVLTDLLNSINNA